MSADKLFISLFDKDQVVSKITVYKRILMNGDPVDILQIKGNDDELDSLIEGCINEKIALDVNQDIASTNFICECSKNPVELIRNDYSEIYSRSWPIANHHIAFRYKIDNPNVFWNAEFSDPLYLNTSNQYRNSKGQQVSDYGLINEWNNEIEKLNGDFPLIEKDDSIYFITEYLIYLFADKITFTNPNQREVMLNRFPIDLKEHVMEKSETKLHPTLGHEFYKIKNIDLNIDAGYINIGYFGNDYYGKRHFENLFYSLESLNHKYKEKIRLHIFLNDISLIERLVNDLDVSSNIFIRKPVEYLEFLNATTQFDVLIVNDLITENVFDKNPYIPSKTSDYLGSGRDIWGICESGSILSSLDIKYKSDIHDYDSSRNVLIQILEDNNYIDNNYSFNDYFESRLTYLNEIVESDYRQKIKLNEEIKKLKRENKKLKKTNSELTNSNSWKLTKPLRALKKNIK